MGVACMKNLITQDFLKSTFQYIPETGRFLRVRRGRGARVGKVVGDVSPDGYVRVNLFNKNWPNSHLVWVWHHGEFPPGILRRKNGISIDDRIENLEVIKKQYKMIEGDACPISDCEYGFIEFGLSGIYEIICITNRRKYIGSAVDLGKRWSEHVRQLKENKHHSRHLQRTWNKYGQDDFVFRVIEYCDKGSLIDREQHYIDTEKPVFNSRPVANSQLGFRHSKESRLKMSMSRDRNFSPMTGRRHTEETKAKISAAKRGVKQSEIAVSRRAAAIRARMGRKSDNRFTETQIRYIRSESEKGRTLMSLAREMACSDSVISEIKNRKTYRWVL